MSQAFFDRSITIIRRAEFAGFCVVPAMLALECFATVSSAWPLP
jgi:hypothetical protein